MKSYEIHAWDLQEMRLWMERPQTAELMGGEMNPQLMVFSGDSPTNSYPEVHFDESTVGFLGWRQGGISDSKTATETKKEPVPGASK